MIDDALRQAGYGHVAGTEADDDATTASVALRRCGEWPSCTNTEGPSERVTGIEPAFSAWEADVLPLNYTRVVRRAG